MNVMMPNMSGVKQIEQVAKRTGYFGLPVITLTDLSQVSDNKTGLHTVPIMALNCYGTKLSITWEEKAVIPVWSM